MNLQSQALLHIEKLIISDKITNKTDSVEDEIHISILRWLELIHLSLLDKENQFKHVDDVQTRCMAIFFTLIITCQFTVLYEDHIKSLPYVTYLFHI